MTEAKQDHAHEGHRPTVHTYPDGSQRVGQPPFPAESPKEEAARSGQGEQSFESPMIVPPGYKTEGEADAPPNGMETEGQFVARVEQKLRSDVLSGKDPSTPNYTTASDKPELVGVVPVDENLKVLDPSDPEDLAKLTSKVDAGVDADEEQVKAAAVQIARETMGDVVVDTGKRGKATKGSKS